MWGTKEESPRLEGCSMVWNGVAMFSLVFAPFPRQWRAFFILLTFPDIHGPTTCTFLGPGKPILYSTGGKENTLLPLNHMIFIYDISGP